MSPSTILQLLAERLETFADATPDLVRLRATATYAQALLKAIELTEVEARLAQLEAERR